MGSFAIVFIAASLPLTPAAAQASPGTGAQQVSLSTDAITWPFDGYSIIASYETARLDGLRFHLEVFGLALPESVIDSYAPNTGEGWQRRVDRALMLSVDHHPFEGMKGLHWGAGFNVQGSTVSRTGHSPAEAYATFEPILRLGYQWFPSARSGLFITPYAALGFPIHLSQPEAIGGEVYGEAAILPVASVQIGWRFPMPPR